MQKLGDMFYRLCLDNRPSAIGHFADDPQGKKRALNDAGIWVPGTQSTSFNFKNKSHTAEVVRVAHSVAERLQPQTCGRLSVQTAST